MIDNAVPMIERGFSVYFDEFGTLPGPLPLLSLFRIRSKLFDDGSVDPRSSCVGRFRAGDTSASDIRSELGPAGNGIMNFGSQLAISVASVA